jgi:hypothetical protein
LCGRRSIDKSFGDRSVGHGLMFGLSLQHLLLALMSSADQASYLR